MQRNYFGALILSVAFFGVSTHSVFAFDTLAQNARTTDANFCASVKTLSAVPDEIAATQKKYEASADTRLKALNDLRADRDRARFDERNTREKNRLEHYVKIEARAVTTAEKNAITAFTRTVDQAIVKRKTAYDTAAVSFRKGINDAIQARNTELEQAIGVFKKRVVSAIERAEKDCRTMQDSKRARDTYLSLLRDARTAFQDAVLGLKNVNTSIDALSIQRNTALEKAEAEFVKAVDKAIIDLKKVFPGA